MQWRVVGFALNTDKWFVFLLNSRTQTHVKQAGLVKMVQPVLTTTATIPVLASPVTKARIVSKVQCVPKQSCFNISEPYLVIVKYSKKVSSFK